MLSFPHLSTGYEDQKRTIEDCLLLPLLRPEVYTKLAKATRRWDSWAAHLDALRVASADDTCFSASAGTLHIAS
jgi:hypothetical protein